MGELIKGSREVCPVFPKWLGMKLCWNSFIFDLSFGQSALLKSRTVRVFCLCLEGFKSALAETKARGAFDLSN